MNKKYKAIFFDWDGTAVTSRTAPVEDAVVAMKPLLQQGTKLVIVSGTTYDKIAGGKFHTYFTEEDRRICSSDWEEGHTTIRSRTIDRKFSHL